MDARGHDAETEPAVQILTNLMEGCVGRSFERKKFTRWQLLPELLYRYLEYGGNRLCQKKKTYVTHLRLGLEFSGQQATLFGQVHNQM